MQYFRIESSSAAENAAVILITLAALALLGFVLAYWTWAWLAPRPEPALVTTAGTPRMEPAYALFGGGEHGTGTHSAPALTLLGVAASSRPGVGRAIVQIDGQRTVVVREGDEVAPGVRVSEIRGTHVVLERGGHFEKLEWPRPRTASQRTPQPGNK